MEWYDLSPYWDELRLKADERDGQKRGYSSTRNWSKHSTHFIGLLGEKAVGLAVGLDVDLDLRAGGDGGRDFICDGKNYEIRSTQYWKDPHLKQKPDAKFWADFYVSVGIDVENRRARIAGWATQNDVRSAKARNYGYGDMLTIESQNLRKGLPPGFKGGLIDE